MAVEKTTTKKDELVEVLVPLGSSQDENFITVGLNGKMYKIKRGEPVMVKPGIAEILRNADLAKAEQRAYLDKITK